jgi:hypothetical protein
LKQPFFGSGTFAISDLQFCSLVAVGVGLAAPGDPLLEQAESRREAAIATMPTTLRTFCAYGFTVIPPNETTLRHTNHRSTCNSPRPLTCGDFQRIYTEASGGILNTSGQQLRCSSRQRAPA